MVERAPQDSTIAEHLAGFAVTLRNAPDGLPKEVRSAACERLLDNLGCIMLGMRVAPARKITDLKIEAASGDCRMIGRTTRTGAAAAAFSQGVFAQAYEMNDLGVYTHPGACVIPACLAALALNRTPTTGAQFVAAVAAGYEIVIRVSEAVGPSAELDVGWHTPGFHGAIGAAASAAMLLGLSSDGVAQAIAMAADLAGGGLMLARLGSDMKRVHCGRAAETGLTCALYAEAGLTSRLDVFENDRWGYCRTMTASVDQFDLEKMTKDLGARFIGFSRTAVKYFPVGAEIQGMIDNVNRLKRETAFDPDDILTIDVGTPRFFVDAETHDVPTTVTNTHFNSAYGVAMALIHDIRPIYESADSIDLWATGFENPAVRALASKVRHAVDEVLEAANPYSVDSSLSIQLRDGRILKTLSAYVRDAESPGTMKFGSMNADRLATKFRMIANHLPDTVLSELTQRVLEFSSVADARTLFDLTASKDV